MTTLRLALLATTALTVGQFAVLPGHAQSVPTVMAQAAPPPETGEPKGPPKQPPKAPPPAAAPKAPPPPAAPPPAPPKAAPPPPPPPPPAAAPPRPAAPPPPPAVERPHTPPPPPAVERPRPAPAPVAPVTPPPAPPKAAPPPPPPPPPAAAPKAAPPPPAAAPSPAAPPPAAAPKAPPPPAAGPASEPPRRQGPPPGANAPARPVPPAAGTPPGAAPVPTPPPAAAKEGTSAPAPAVAPAAPLKDTTPPTAPGSSPSDARRPGQPPPPNATPAPGPTPAPTDTGRPAGPATQAPGDQIGVKGAVLPPAAPKAPPAVTTAIPPAPAPAQALTPLAPGATAPGPRSLNEFRGERRETQEGGRTVITEPGRVIVRDPNGQSFIRHNEVDRFRYGARDIRVQQSGNESRTIVVRPDGSEIITVTGRDGQLLRRIRRDREGREIIIIDNAYREPRDRGSFYVDLPPPRIGIPQNRYIVDYEDASPELIYETLEAPPVERIERRYSLDEIRYSPSVRQRMPSIDLNTITFESGSWDISPDQASKLQAIADGLNRSIQRNPREVFLIEGHTDATGNDTDNLSLSDRRAESAAALLTQQFGVPAENLTSQGYGEQYLKVPTQGPERLNRRVTVRRITPLLNGGTASLPPPPPGTAPR